MYQNYSLHIEELINKLQHIDPDIIRQEFETLLKFKVPIEEIKSVISGKFGSNNSPIVKIKDISNQSSIFSFVGRIVYLKSKKLHIKNKIVNIYKGKIIDETGIAFFTSWIAFPFNSGDIVMITNAYIKEWNNLQEIYLGQKSTAISLPENLSFPNENNIIYPKKMAEIISNDTYVSSQGIITELYHTEVQVKGDYTNVIQGVISDETGKLPFTSWIPFNNIDIGTAINFENAQIKIFRGLPTINFTLDTIISVFEPDNSYISNVNLSNDSINIFSLSSLSQREGAFDIVVRGNIVSIRSGSGLIDRCSVCNRVIKKGNCRAHGSVESIEDMRIKAILDDGTGTAHIILNRDLSEKILNLSIHDIQIMKESENYGDILSDVIKKQLIGFYFYVRGNSSLNQFGANIIVSDIWEIKDELLLQVDELLCKLEELK